MYSIPPSICQTLITTFSGIISDDIITEQSVEDTYKDDHERYVRRTFILSSRPIAGKTYCNFTFKETLPDKVVKRLDLDFVTDMYEDAGLFFIVSEGCTVQFAVDE